MDVKMKITTRHYNECVKKTMKKLNNDNNLLKTLLYNTTAYIVERYLFEGGRCKETIYFFNNEDFIKTTAKATLDLVVTILHIKDLVIATELTLDVAEFCTVLCEEIFNEKDY